MADDDIVQEIKIEGETDAVEVFTKIGDAAEKGLGKIDEAAAKASSALERFSTQLNFTTNKASENSKNVSESVTGFGKLEGAASRLGSALKDVGSSVGDFSSRMGLIAGVSLAAVGGIVLLSKSLLDTVNKSDEAGKSSRELRQEVKATNQIFTDQQTRAVSNARAFSELSHQLVTGKVSVEEYSTQFRELERTQKNAEEDAIKVAIIQEEATKRRLEEVKALEKEQEKRKALNDLIKKFGSDLTNSLLRLGNTAEDFWREFVSGPSLAARAVDAIQDVLDRSGSKFIEIFNRIAKSFASIFDIKENQNAAEELSKKMVHFGESVANVVENIIVPALKTLFNILDVVASHLSKALGFDITAESLVILLIVAKISGAFTILTAVLGVARVAFGLLTVSALPWLIILGLVAAAIFLLVTNVDWKGWAQKAVDAGQSIVDKYNAVGKFFTDFWNDIKQGASDAWNWVKQKASDAAQGAEAIWNDTIKFFIDLWDTIKTGAADAWQWVKDKGAEAWDAIVSFIQPVIDKLTAAWDWAKKLVAALGEIKAPQGLGDSSANGEAIPGAAGGGLITGPGTSTSDSILARLSNREWVMNAEAVRYYGTTFMNMVNSKRLPIPQFNLGGLVQKIMSPIELPRFASGGQVVAAGPRGQAIVLNIGQETFQLLAKEADTADRLARFATRRQLASAGPKPSYYGV